MNEKTFLMQLDAELKQLSKEEKEDILHDYKEHFAMAREEGKTEDQIAKELGSPQKLAKEMLAMYHVSQAESKTTTGNMFRAVWAGIGVSFFNLIIVLGPFCALVAVVIAGWATAVSLILSPLVIPVNMVMFPGTLEGFDVFALMVISGIGMFLFIGMYYITKGFKWGFLHYLRWNISLVKGGLRG